MSSQQSVASIAGKYWDDQLEKLRSGCSKRVRWWDDDTTKRHINNIVGRSNSAEVHFAFHHRIAKILEGKKGLKALSVGCGVGTKEIWLMQMIDVERFDLFDISPANIAFGQEEAARMGISSKMVLRCEDAFSAALGDDYDLVYWNNALHHMPDVSDALRWSSDRLKPRGLLAMDDFVGPSRFQWSDTNLDWATRVRQELPTRLLRNPYVTEGVNFLPAQVIRPTPEEVVASDPSEAIDSGSIVNAIKFIFPNHEIIPTGGALYHLALNDIFCNFVTDDDFGTLRQILLFDLHLAEHGTTHYAVAFAFK